MLDLLANGIPRCVSQRQARTCKSPPRLQPSDKCLLLPSPRLLFFPSVSAQAGCQASLGSWLSCLLLVRRLKLELQHQHSQLAGTRVSVSYLKPAQTYQYARLRVRSSSLSRSIWTDDFDEMGREGEREREEEEAGGEWMHPPSPPSPPWLAHPLPRFASGAAAGDECVECVRQGRRCRC